MSFTASFDQFNVSLLNKNVSLFKNVVLTLIILMFVSEIFK